MATIQTTLQNRRRMGKKSGIQIALDKFDGSPTKLAAAVGNGVLRQHVQHWLKAGRVSPEKCPEVSAATGVTCEALNDNVDWKLAAKVGADAERAV